MTYKYLLLFLLLIPLVHGQHTFDEYIEATNNLTNKTIINESINESINADINKTNETIKEVKSKPKKKEPQLDINLIMIMFIGGFFISVIIFGFFVWILFYRLKMDDKEDTFNLTKKEDSLNEILEDINK